MGERSTMEPITTAVIQVLLQQLYKSLEDHVHRLHQYEGEFEKMKTKLNFMKSFLTDTQREERNQKNYMIVKEIQGLLRDLIYDAGDILLDCQIRADYEKAFRYHRYSPNGLLLFRQKASNALKKMNKRIEEMENQLKTYFNPVNQIMLSSNEGSSGSAPRISPTHFSSQSEIIGLKEDTQKIIAWIETKEMLCQLGIVGMGGSGKTTIAQKILSDKVVARHFDKMIWVFVSQIFSQKDILRSMLNQLGVDDHHIEANNEMSQIKKSLNKKKYLIVMDDVWSIDYTWWRLLSEHLPEGRKCKKFIIITTRNETVAKNMGATYIHHARKLNENESWDLFCKAVFIGNKSKSLDSEFQTVGRAIAKKCEGVPLAIKTIAGLLSAKMQSVHQWKEVSNNFHDELGNNTPVSASLQLSYDDLPAKLKHCILCFSIYPKNTEIIAEQLVYWWVGEGFVEGDGSKTAIEVGFKCLLELVSRCLVEVVKPRGYNGRIYKCKMHEMVRDLIIKISKEETFSSFNGRKEHKPDMNSRHLGYTSGMDEKLLENNSMLRAFLLVGNCSFSFHRNTGLVSVKSLRVLDLSRNKLENIVVEDLLSWIKTQKRLAYLNLRRVGGLKELPDWIKKHQNLQVLVITECNNLKRLPPSLTSLQNLVVLDVESCPLQNLPQGFEKLTKLQVLSGFKLTRKGENGTSLGELKGLEELRELRINISKNDEIADDEARYLSQLHQLKVLSIETKDCEKKQVRLVNKLSPPPSLQELYLRSYDGDTMPNWATPSSLPELLYLRIDDAQLTSVGTNFWDSNEKPWKIEGLCFKHLLRFKLDWRVVRSNIKHLRYVEVSHCPGLDSFPGDVNNFGIWEKN